MAEFVLGSVQLGLAYGAANKIGKPTRQAALGLVRRAVDSGVRQFDTARAYGDAEERLGEALEGRKAFTVTKLSPLTELDDDASHDQIISAVDRSIEESLHALRRTSLDCLLLHRCAHMTAFGGAIWHRLLEHKQEGRIQRLGVSVQTPEEAKRALDSPNAEHIQLPYNLLDWRWREAGLANRFLRRRTLTVHARSVFLQGLLASEDPGVWPKIEGVDPADVLLQIKSLAEMLGRESIADLCLAYVRGLEFIGGVVIGMETPEQLDLNLRLSVKRPLTPKECWEVEQSVPRLPEQLLNPALWPKA